MASKKDTASTGTPQLRIKQPKSTGKKILLGMFVLFVLILGGGWFALTNSAVFCKYILPQVGVVLGAKLSASEAVIHPFSEITLRNLKFQYEGQAPLADVAEVKVRYKLGAFLRKRVEVAEITLDKPRLHVVVKPDGKNNLGHPSPTAAQPADPRGTNGAVLPPQVSVQNITIRDGLVEYLQQKAGGAQDSFTLSGINLGLDGIANGKPSKLRVTALLGLLQRAADGSPSTTSPELKGKLALDLGFELSPALVPKGFKSSVSAEVTETSSGLSDLNALAARLEFALEQNELRKFDLTFDQRGLELGRVTALGDFDFNKSEGRVEFQVPVLDRKVLNLLGAAKGLDFDRSSFSANAVIHVTKGGSKIASQGRLTGRTLSLRSEGKSTPPMDLDLNYELKSDLKESSLSLDAFRVTIKQGNRELVTGWIDFPFGFSWVKGKSTSFTRSTFRLNLADLNLADWRATSGHTNLAGKLGADFVLTSTPENKQISLNLRSRLDQFAMDTLSQSRLDLEFAGQYAIRADTHLLGGKLAIANPAGAPGDLVPQALQFDGHFDLASKPEVLQLRSASMVVKNGQEPAGSMDLSGQHFAGEARGNFTFKLNGLNENALRPFTAAALRDRTLVKALINANAALNYDARAGATVGAEFAVNNLVFSDLAGARKSQPFAVALRLDATSRAGLHELKELTVALVPTDRASNRLDMVGRADLRDASNSQATIRIAADSLDFTPLVDLMDVKTVSAAPAPATPKSARTPVPTEPAAINLPVRQFNADLAIGKLFLRQVAVTNWTAAIQAKDNVVTVKPFDLWLNGAPTKLAGEFNLGVRGWTYEFDCSADKVPVQPLVDSFSPANAGRVRVQLLLNGKIKGAGVTGASLRKSLAGELGFSLMNAEISVLSESFKKFIAPIGAILRVPELSATPINWVGARLAARDGRIELSETRVASDAFVANLNGSIPMAEVLSESPLDLPARIELRRSLAQKAKLIPPGTPDAAYVALPDFARVTGTLGEPKPKFNEAALVGLGLNFAGNLVGGNTKAGQTIQSISGLLTGQPAVTRTNASGTNAPGTNAAPAFNPFNLLKPKK